MSKNGHSFENEAGEPIKDLGKDTRFARFLNGYTGPKPALLDEIDLDTVKSYLARAKIWLGMIPTSSAMGVFESL